MLVYPTGIPTGAAGYTIENAIWLDGSSDYLNKTFSGTGTNRKKFTFSCWFKLGALGATGTLLSCDDTSSDKEFMFWVQSDGTIRIANYQDSTNKLNLITSRVLRDPTAWTHLVLSANTDSVTPSVSTIKLYINGVQVQDADLSTKTYPVQDFEFALGNSFDHEVGRYALSNNNLWNGYIAEMVFIDGNNLDSTDFGELDDNGVWVPKDPSGLTFGTNGFHLDFKVAPGTGNGAGTDAVGGGVKQNISGGTATNPGGGLHNFSGSGVLDDDTAQDGFYLTGDEANQTVDVDLGSGNDLAITGAGWIVENDGSNDQAAVWSIFYSDNGSDWTDTNQNLTVADNATPMGEQRTLITGQTAHRYWRFSIDSTDATGNGWYSGLRLYTGDSSRFANNFTDNSMTTAQQVTDTCTDNASSNIGNYITWNPIHKAGTGNAILRYGNTNRFSSGLNAGSAHFATLGVSSGRYYVELKYNDVTHNNPVGVGYMGYLANSSTGVWIDSAGDTYNNNVLQNNGASLSNGDIIGIDMDLTNDQVSFYVNDSIRGSALTLANNKPSDGHAYSIFNNDGGGQTDVTILADPADWTHSAKGSGVALNTANLAAPTVNNPDDGFALITLENGNTIEASLANARAGWSGFIDVFKREDGTNEDYDVRFSDDSGNSMHFNTNAAAGSDLTLASGVNYSAWSWRVGATYGCYTAEISHSNGSATNQAHSLGSGAKTAVAKRSDSTGDWYVSHPNMSSANIRFNVQEASTSELVTVDGTNVTLNSSFASGTYRVIVWEQIEGFSAFVGYSHNGLSDGPYIHFGGSASLVAWRNIDSSNSNDFFATFPSYTSNGNGNPTDIRYNWSNGEKGYSGITIGDVTANGYKMRPSAGSAFGSGADDPMLVWAWGLRPFGGSGVAQARAR